MNATYLSFHIGNEVYAVKTDNVLEVLQHQTITPIPNSPEYIKGIVNFRGEGIIVLTPINNSILTHLWITKKHSSSLWIYILIMKSLKRGLLLTK